MKIFEQVLLLAVITLTASQVIGIDLGTEFWKAALISPGKNLVIVENSRSSRKSHNGIAFLDGVRHFEYDAFGKRLKKPRSSYFYLNKLIESLDHQAPLPGYHFENGTYYFEQGQDRLSLQQLVGMILKNIKKYSSAQAASDIKDAVFTVPAHWGFRARLSLVNAAYIAQLSALGVVNENSAAAIHFSITRNDSDPVYVGFFNLGSHNLQISIVQFFGTLDEVKNKNIQSLRVLSHVSVPNVGGLAVDQAIAEHIAQQFELKHKIDVRKNQKAWIKLLHKSSDAKQVLSANKEANVYIEALVEGIDLNIIVKREIIEQSPIFQTIKAKLQQAVKKAGLSKQQLQAVEVIGGASRIPLVNKIVKDFFEPVQVGSHINGDQSMAFGSALRAANLSIAFRVKQLHFYDGYPQQVRAVVSNAQDGVLKQAVLFDKNSEHGLKKDVVVDECEEDIKVSIFYGEDLLHQYIISNLSNWKSKYNETELNITSKQTVLTFSANSITVGQLKQAYINITLNTSTTRDVYELVVQNVTIEQKNPDSDNQTNDTKTQEDQNDQKQQGQQTKNSETQASEEKQETTDSTKKQSKKPRIRERTRNVKKTIDDFKIESKKYLLKIQHQFSKYRRYTKEDVELLREVLTKYEKHQNYLKERAKVRNDFQSTLYALKDDFENPGLKAFSTEEQLEKLKTTVSQQLTWLQENAWTAEKIDFEKHYRSVQRVYNPIVNRSQEYNQREKAYNQTLDILSLVYSKTAELNSTQPWVSEKALNHLKKINETFQWIQQKVKKQVARKPNDDIIFYNHQMIDKAEDLRDQYYLIKMTPRPKVVRKVPEVKINPETESEPQVKANSQSQSDPQDTGGSENENQGEPQSEPEQKQDL